MKQCPVCKRAYADDRLGYCLEDGIALIDAPNNLNSDQPPTQPSPRVKYAAPAPTQQIAPGHFGQFQQNAETHVQKKGKGWIIFALVALFAIVIALISGFLVLRKVNAPLISNQTTSVNSTTNSNQLKPLISTTPAATRTAAQLVGTWKTHVVENKIPTNITVIFNRDGTSKFLFQDKQGRTNADAGTWQYSDGLLYEKYSNGASGKASINWIDDDNFELTIIDNGVPAYSGVVRRYRRAG